MNPDEKSIIDKKLNWTRLSKKSWTNKTRDRKFSELKNE